jgi:hypothetical protein
MGKMGKARGCRAFLLTLFSLPFAHSLYQLSYWGIWQQVVNLAGFRAMNLPAFLPGNPLQQKLK